MSVLSVSAAAGDQFAPIERQVQQHPKTDQEDPNSGATSTSLAPIAW
jgi:hypothetical protein